MDTVVMADGTMKVTNKLTEATKVTIPEWKGTGKLRRWVADLVDACRYASGRTDHMEKNWIVEVYNAVVHKNHEVEHFAQIWSGEAHHRLRFERLDRALRAGMKPFVTKNAKEVDFKVSRHDEKFIFSTR